MKVASPVYRHTSLFYPTWQRGGRRTWTQPHLTQQHPLGVRLRHHLRVKPLSKPLVPTCPALEGLQFCPVPCSVTRAAGHCVLPPHTAPAARERGGLSSRSTGSWPCLRSFPQKCLWPDAQLHWRFAVWPMSPHLRLPGPSVRTCCFGEGPLYLEATSEGEKRACSSWWSSPGHWGEGLKAKLFLKGFFSLSQASAVVRHLSHQNWGEGHIAAQECLLATAAQAAGGSS